MDSLYVSVCAPPFGVAAIGCHYGGLRKAVVDGDVKTGSVMSGQIAGMVKDVPTCKELMARLIRETKETVKKNSFLVEE